MPEKIFNIEKIVNFIIKATILVLPLFFLPWTGEYFEFNKQFFLWFTMPLALFLWLLSLVRRGELKFKTNPLNLPILLFLFLALLAAVFSLDRFSSFFGYFGRFADAWLGLFSLVIFYFLLVNTTVADSAEKIRGLMKLFVYSALAAAAAFLAARLGLLSLFLKDRQSFLASPWFNPAGASLLNLEIFLALAAVLISGWFFGRKLKQGERLVFGAGLVLILTVFALANFSFFDLKAPKEARLGYSSALKIAAETLKARPFFGSGPGTFAYDFSLYRPAELNQSSFWQIRFDESASRLMEMPATYGAVTFLSYVLLWGLVIYLNVKLLIKRLRSGERTDYSLFIVLAAAFILLLLAEIFFPASTVLNFSFWLFLGLLMAFWQTSEPAVGEEKRFILSEGSIYAKLWPAGLFLIGALGFLLYSYEIKFFAADVFAAGAGNRQAGLIKALKLNPSRYNYGVNLAKFYLSRAGVEAQKPSEKSNNNYIQANVSSAIDAAKLATAVEPASVLSWETLGMVYRDIGPLTVGSEPWAAEAFSRALALEPTNPILATELARAYFKNNDLAAAEAYFKKAVGLKPDYHEARFGLAKVYLKGKNDALALKLLIELARDVADQEVFYELGRFYYNHGEIDKAIERFGLVLSLNSGHANALYSLGIAFEARGQADEALKYYEKVLELNPGNKEVERKINNLKK